MIAWNREDHVVLLDTFVDIANNISNSTALFCFYPTCP